MGEEMRGRVSLDLSAFERAALKGQQVAKNFGVSVEKSLGISQFKGMVAGALSVAAVTSSVNALLEKADGIDALAKRFDITAEGIQSIQYAADQTGASAESMFMALKKLTVALEEARDGNKEYRNALLALGVSLGDIKSKNAEQVFYQIGKRAEGAAGETMKFSDGIKVFGRAGDQALGSMRDGFATVAAGAKKAGVVIENDFVKKLADAHDQVQKLKAQITVGGASILSPIVSYIQSLGSRLGAASVAAQNTNQTGDDKKDIAQLYRFLGAMTVGVGGDFEVRKAKLKRAVDGGGGPGLKFRGASFSAPNLTDNQRIGAFSNQNPFLNRQLAIEQEMVKIQNAIKKATEDTAKAAQATVRAVELQTF